MRYEVKRGTNMIRKGIVFKNGDRDPKGRRPVVIIVDKKAYEKKGYFLTMTSQSDQYINRDKQYYPVKEGFSSYGLTKASYINLKEVYQANVDDGKSYPIGAFDDGQTNSIISHLKQFQKILYREDSDYSKIKSRL